MKKISLLILLFLSLFLVSCWKKQKQDNAVVKFSNYTMDLPKDFMIYPSTKKDLNLKKFTVLSSYRYKKVSKWFAPSLIILRYDWKFPKDKKEFFSLLIDKFKREIVWSEILENGNLDIDWKTAYYFKYKVSDNMFDDTSLNTYYGIQFYLFDNPNIYLISYVGIEENSLNDIFGLLKNLNYKK